VPRALGCAVIAALAAIAAGHASAAAIRWQLEGRVAGISELGEAGQATATSLGLVLGAPVSATLEIASETAGYVESWDAIYYGGVSRFDVTIGALQLTASPGDLIVYSDAPGSPFPYSYTFLSPLPRGSLPGLTPAAYAVALQLLGAPGSPAPGLGIPADPPALDSLVPFDLAAYSLSQNTSGMMVSGDSFVTYIEPTQLRRVETPEVGIVAMTALALATQWLARAWGAQSLRQGSASSSARDT
jgi:hypothetical protein